MALTAYQQHMKRELKGKMKGKTAAQRKAIFKAAAASYKPGIRNRVSKAVTRARSVRARIQTKNTGGNHTAKGGFNTQKIFKVLRMGALALPAVTEAVQPWDPVTKLQNIMRMYTGYDVRAKKFDLMNLAQGWAPYVGASVATYAAPRIGHLIRSFM